MVGRFGLSDITPVVGSTTSAEFPARGVVGEPIPVSAVVFREGHDKIAASVVVRSGAKPAGKKGQQTVRMEPGAPGTDRWHATVVLDEPGTGDLHHRGVERPDGDVAPRRHRQDRGRSGRRGPRERPRDRGAAVRAAREEPPEDRARARRRRGQGAARHQPRRRPPRRTRARPVPPATRARFPGTRPRARRRRATRCSSTASAPSTARGTSSSRDRSAPSSPATRPLRQPGPARHVQGLDRAPRLRRVARLRRRLPAADPPDRRGRRARAPTTPWSRRAGTSASPWAIGSEDGGHDAIHPRAGHDGRLHRVREARPRAGPGGRARPRAAVRARPPVGAVAPGVVHHQVRTARSRTPRTRRRSTRTSTRSTSTTTPRACTPSACGIVRHWIDAGVTIFRVDNPHTKPINFWQWLLGEVRKTNPEIVFLAEAFTRPAMMHELAKVGFHQSYTYFTWRNDRDELREYGEQIAAAAHYMRPNFFTNTPDILNEYLVHGGPGSVLDPRRARGDDDPDVGRVLRLRALRAPESARGQRGVPGLGEVPAAAARLRRRHRRGTVAGAAAGQAEPDPARPSRAAPAAQPALPRCVGRRHPRVQQTGFELTGDTVLVVCTTNPHAGARGDGARWTCRHSAWPGTPGSPCTTC